MMPKGKDVLDESLNTSGSFAGVWHSLVLCLDLREETIRNLTVPFLIMSIFDMNVLYDAFRASMKGSAWKEEPQRFEIDFLSEITALSEELENRTYKTMKGSEFILNERGKIRFIHGSRMRDRVVRHALCDTELGPNLSKYLIYNNGASQKGKGITFARKRFEKDLHNYWLKYRTNDGYIALIDLSKFYDNIQHDRVRETVFPHISSDSQWLLDEILKTFEVDVSFMSDEEYAGCMNDKFDSVTYHQTIPEDLKTGQKFMKKSVDIGDQVSQDIGVFFPTPLDNYVTIVNGISFYGRYMDDIYIIDHDRKRLESLIEGMAEQAKALGMFINERKTHIARLSDTFTFLQFRYYLTDNGRVMKRINQKAITRARRRFKAYKRLFDAGKMDYDDIEQSYKSWMGEYTKVMSKRQTKNMKRLFKELFGKEPKWKQ